MPKKRAGEVRFSSKVFDYLMPLHLRLDGNGRIVAVGRTLHKLAPGLCQREETLFQAFELRRPARVRDMASLRQSAGQRLYLNLRDCEPPVAFRGVALPLAGETGMLVNLSFGIGVVEAVRNFSLADSDFSPTGLAVEMLYLFEAKSAVMEELHNLNRRLESAKAEAEARAMTDILTGLANRRAANLFLSDLEALGRPFALMQLDLDYFKAVNDNFGHAAGDRVLVTVAQAMRSQTRSGDLVARPGGDEFLLAFPDLTDGAELKALARRLIEQIREPIPYHGRMCRVSASIGIATTEHSDGAGLKQMIRDADAALYAAKRAGRGTMRLYADPEPEGKLGDLVRLGA